MTKIGGVCLVTIAIWVTIELAVQFGYYKHSCGPGTGAESEQVWTRNRCVQQSSSGLHVNLGV